MEKATRITGYTIRANFKTDQILIDIHIAEGPPDISQPNPLTQVSLLLDLQSGRKLIRELSDVISLLDP